jgi:hypothetical protein
MNESDLCKLRDALNKPTLMEAIKAVESVLNELGYYKYIIGVDPAVKEK